MDPIFLHPPPLETEGCAFARPPRAIQLVHSREMIRTTLARFGRLSRRRSSIVRSPSRAAWRKAPRAVVTHTPARAAISPRVRRQAPRSRTASATILSAASSPVVNRAGELRRHGAGRGERSAPLYRRASVRRARRFALRREMTQPSRRLRLRRHLRDAESDRIAPAHLSPPRFDRLGEILRLIVGQPPCPPVAPHGLTDSRRGRKGISCR